MNEPDILKRLELLSLSREELMEQGAVLAIDPDEAEELGAFEEDALSEEDALEWRMA